MEQALEQIRKDAKANKDKQKLQKVKSEEKYQEIRRSRNKKDKK
jgi:hypothetical protein